MSESKCLVCKGTGLNTRCLKCERQIKPGKYFCKICECKHKNTTLEENVGYDIWVGGEEEQHEETCNDCNASRFVCDVYEYDEPEKRVYGKWHDSKGRCIEP